MASLHAVTLGEVFSVSSAFAWAIAVIFLKQAGERIAALPLALFKSLLALSLFCLTLLSIGVKGALPPTSVVILSLVSGALGIGAGDLLYLSALNMIGAGRIAVAQTLYSPFVILLAMLFLNERLRALQFVGVGVVLVGILVMSYSRDASGNAGQLRRGVLIAIASMLAMAAGIVMAKPILERYDFMTIVTLRLAGGVGGVLFWLLSTKQVPQTLAGLRHGSRWLQAVCGAFMGTYLSMMLWLAGYKYTKASIAAVLNETAAPFILLLAAFWLREHISRRNIAGAAIAVGGVLLVVSQ